MRTLVVQSVVLLVIATAAAGPEHPQRPLRRNEAYDPSEVSSSFWHEEAKAGIQQRLNRKPNVNVARNVIMFLGDGMSIPTLAAARTLMGQRNNKTGEETQMFMEAFPTVGLSKVISSKLGILYKSVFQTYSLPTTLILTYLYRHTAWMSR